MSLENLARKVKHTRGIEDSVNEIDAEIRDLLEKVSTNAEAVCREFASLDKEQQEQVAERVLQVMDRDFAADLRGLLRGAVTAGIFSGGLTTALGGPGVLIAGAAAVAVVFLVPLVRAIEKKRISQLLAGDSPSQS